MIPLPFASSSFAERRASPRSLAERPLLHERPKLAAYVTAWEESWSSCTSSQESSAGVT